MLYSLSLFLQTKHPKFGAKPEQIVEINEFIVRIPKETPVGCNPCTGTCRYKYWLFTARPIHYRPDCRPLHREEKCAQQNRFCMGRTWPCRYGRRRSHGVQNCQKLSGLLYEHHRTKSWCADVCRWLKAFTGASIPGF